MPGQPSEGRVRRVELLDLLDRRPAAEPGEPADQLHVDEVAGRQRIGFAAAEEAEALDGPRADLRNREQAPVGRADPPGTTRPAAIWRATAGSAIERFGERPSRSSSAGARPAISAAERHVAQRPSRGSRARPQRPTMRRSICGRPPALDQLLDDRPGERLPRPGAAPRPRPGAAADQRAEQRVAAEAAEELAEVVVDPEREAHPLRRLERAAAARPAQLGVERRRRQIAPTRVDGLGAGSRHPPPSGARRGPGPGSPRPASSREATPARIVISDRRPPDVGRRYGEAGRDLQLEGAAAQPALSGRAGGRRQGRSGWRGRSPGRSACAARRCAAARPREPRGADARTAATVTAPARTPPAAAIAAVRTSAAQDGRSDCSRRRARGPGSAAVGYRPRRPPRRATSPSISNFSVTRLRLARACVATAGALRKPRNVRLYEP